MATVRALFQKQPAPQAQPLATPAMQPQNWLDPRLFAPQIDTAVPLKGMENFAAGLSDAGKSIMKGTEGMIENGLKERELKIKEAELPLDLKLKEAQANYWTNFKGKSGDDSLGSMAMPLRLFRMPDGKVVPTSSVEEMKAAMAAGGVIDTLAGYK